MKKHRPKKLLALVRTENVAASTQNQALSALLFLYREALHQYLGPADALRGKRPKRLRTVLTRDETLRLIGCLSGTHPQPGWLGCPQPLGFSNYRGLTWARIVIATLS